MPVNTAALISTIASQNEQSTSKLKALSGEITALKLTTTQAFDEFIRMQTKLRDSILSDYDIIDKRVRDQIAALDGGGVIDHQPQKRLSHRSG
jgi:hypothetical protein